MASATSPTVTCSPVETTTSCSRWFGLFETAPVSLSRRLVSPDMAETTTTMSWPAVRAAMARRATLRMRSTSPTDVPPYFWTMSATAAASEACLLERALERQRAAALQRHERALQPAASGVLPAGAAVVIARLRGLEEVERHRAGEQHAAGDG